VSQKPFSVVRYLICGTPIPETLADVLSSYPSMIARIYSILGLSISSYIVTPSIVNFESCITSGNNFLIKDYCSCSDIGVYSTPLSKSASTLIAFPTEFILR